MSINMGSKRTNRRRGLQLLQPSIESPDILVPASPRILKPHNDQISRILKSVSEAAPDKENVQVPRRSKRQAVATLNKLSTISALSIAQLSPIKAPKDVYVSPEPKSRKAKRRNFKNSKTKAGPTQPKIDSFLVPSTDEISVSESTVLDAETIKESTKIESGNTTHCVRVFPSFGEDTIKYALDEHSEEYKKLSNLAEERRVALERTLYDNEQLHDQLQILQSENFRLTSALEQCEELIVQIRDSVPFYK